MSNDQAALTPKMRKMSLSEGGQAGNRFESLEAELEAVNNTLFLNYMMKNEPFETLPTQYFPHERLDHHPPEFKFGIALTEAQLVGYAQKHGLATEQLDSAYPDWPTVHREIESRLHKQLEVKPEEGLLFWAVPWTKNKKSNLLLSLCTNYNRKIRVANPGSFVKQLEDEFGQRAKWYMSRPRDDGPALQTHYKISADKMKAQAARVAKAKRAARAASQKV
ncbi:hypothetical protein AAF712_010653 [Marasmius tenuissimus]|uniref:Uncharacterized protein n=1 Tax=Marasmius tenuissimus TaxID=585030 RepID=A0ABR2ZLI3_9AGAR